ncbi:MAG: hypothetical protein ACBZ72_00365 [Candidatus Bathyarchaeia archaeon]|jgi:hypothetical protein
MQTVENQGSYRETLGDYDFSSDDGVHEIDLHNEFWSHGEFELVGHGERTNNQCGKFKKFMGCLNIEGHNQARHFLGNLPKDSVFVKPIYHSCDKPTCPICFKFGWAVREATRMEARLRESSHRYGLIEHIVASVPAKLYGLNLDQLRKAAVKVLDSRGIIGGSMIFHGFRYANRREAKRKGVPFGWRWNPHFHVLGFVGGEGYGKCRKCKGADCYTCKGFEGITRIENKKDGWVVKVLEKRKTVGGTCWYQLNHCSIRRGKKKSHAATWFGVCSYGKLKPINTEDVGIHTCPICNSKLVQIRYLGNFAELGPVSRRGEVLSMFGADGKPLWEVVKETKFRRYSGSYESPI